MHRLPRFLTRSRDKDPTDRGKHNRRPRLERLNAAKNIDYEATSSCSSLDGFSSSSLLPRSLDLSHQTSFRIEGTDGEFDRIFRSLGLSGPEDFAIPAEAWEEMKVSSSLDLFPTTFGRPRTVEPAKHELDETESSARVLESVKSTQLEEVRLNTGGGIKGVRPPLLKPPPSMTVRIMDNGCSTWDLVRDLAPENATTSSSVVVIEDEVDKRGEYEHLSIPAAFSESYSFTTSNDDDDSSSSTTEPMANISPNGRFRRIINEWQKGDLLGRGSFGSVYEGIAGDGFFFAVKEVSLLDQGSQGRQSVYQLEQEIALLSQFEHQNIVRYYGTDKDDSKLYIFLELVTQGSLMNLYQRYHLRDSQVSSYTKQILHGLKYLHDRKVLHRDIKCANILVHADGSVKLADFGLAKATKLNDVKSCKGTAFWMAPEVVNRRTHGYGLPADIWSLGCTVLEMLTRQIPYSDLERPEQAVYRIGNGVPPSVPELLSPDARDFILQCLQVNPDNRPTSDELLEHSFVRRSLSSSLGSASPFRGPQL